MLYKYIVVIKDKLCQISIQLQYLLNHSRKCLSSVSNNHFHFTNTRGSQ